MIFVVFDAFPFFFNEALISKNEGFVETKPSLLKTCQSMGTGSAILLEAAKHAEASNGASVFEAFGMHGQRWPYVAVCGRS